MTSYIMVNLSYFNNQQHLHHIFRNREKIVKPFILLSASLTFVLLLVSQQHKYKARTRNYNEDENHNNFIVVPNHHVNPENYNYTSVVAEVYDKLNTEGMIGRTECKDEVCSEFVTNAELKCARRIKIDGHRVTPTCHFQNGKLKPLVVLRSFPGSGNTWTRLLLEKTTGICTGKYSPWLHSNALQK